jgi:Flp pilus assembly protein TadD
VSRTSIAALFFACTLFVARGFAADAAVQSAVNDLQHQNYKSAEQKLRAEVNLHPSDAETLSLLGVALDEQQKFAEARDFHKRAVSSAPNSAAALYNYANNLLATRDEKGARDVLLKAIAANPADRNSNAALAQIAVNQKNGVEALSYLNRLPDGQDIAIVKLAALDLAGQRDQANALFTQISNATQNDARTSEAAAQILSKAGQFEQAETFLTHALAVEPSNFQLKYTLGVTAAQAGHNDRAKTVLEAAGCEYALYARAGGEFVVATGSRDSFAGGGGADRSAARRCAEADGDHCAQSEGG